MLSEGGTEGKLTLHCDKVCRRGMEATIAMTVVDDEHFQALAG